MAEMVEAGRASLGKGHIHTAMKQENSRVGQCTAGEDLVS